MSRWIAVLVPLGTFLAISTPARAFDGNRKGFMLGAGLGLGMTSFTQEVEITGLGSNKSDRESKTGLATDFRIGAGLSEQFSLYYVNRVAWFSIDNALGDKATIANSVGLVGGTYHLKPEGPSFYLNGLIGLSSWAAPFESGSDASTGFGFGLGAGYEFSKHWSVEGNLGFGSPSDESGGVKLTTNATTFSITINGTAY